MRISLLLFTELSVICLLVFSLFGETSFAAGGIDLRSESLDSRHQLQQKRKRDALQQQQHRDSNINLQAEIDETENQSSVESETPCFHVDKIMLKGEHAAKFHFALDGLLDHESEILGQCLGVNNINLIIKKLQNRIIQKGYVTTRVLAQPQDLSSGELKLTVIGGFVSQITDNKHTMTPSLLSAAIPIRPGELLNIRDLEQGIENLTRVPTVDAEVDIRPADGKQGRPGASQILVNHSQKKPYRLTLSVDDSGYESTGRYQGAMTLSLDNPLNLSDLFYLSLNRHLGHADNGGGTDGYTAHYSIPYGYWLFSATSSQHEYWQNVAGLNQAYEYSGKSRRHEAGLSRIVFRDSRSKLKLGFKAYKMSSRNYIEDTEIEVQHRRMSGWIASLNYQLFIKRTAVDFGLSYQRGTGAFDAMPAPEAAFDQGTSRPKIIRANLNLNFPFELVGRAFNFSSYWEAQWNKTSLVPQDRLSIGGRYTIRGFDGRRTLLAERGWFSQNTLSMRFNKTPHQLYTGIDVGHVSGQSARRLLGQTLAGWVVGIKGRWKGLFYDFFAGMPLEKPKGFESGRHLGFSLTYQY